MDSTIGSDNPHWSFWVIGALALIWHAMGCLNFFVQMDPATLATYPESHRVIVESQPIWAYVGFALSVFGGALGSLALLLRKPMALALFVIALIGTVAVMAHTLSLPLNLSRFDRVMIIVMPLGVLAFLIGYARWAAGRGWLD